MVKREIKETRFPAQDMDTQVFPGPQDPLAPQDLLCQRTGGTMRVHGIILTLKETKETEELLECLGYQGLPPTLTSTPSKTR